MQTDWQNVYVITLAVWHCIR